MKKLEATVGEAIQGGENAEMGIGVGSKQIVSFEELLMS